MAARNAVLKYLRVGVRPLLPSRNPTAAGGGGLSQLIRRHFAGEANGSSLNKSEITDRVMKIVISHLSVDPSMVTPDTLFAGELHMDSLDGAEIFIALEAEFGVEFPDHEAAKMKNIRQTVDFIASQPHPK